MRSVTITYPFDARLVSVCEGGKGEWEVYLGPPGHSWLVKGGPAKHLEAALEEAIAAFERRKAEWRKSAPTIDLSDLNL